MSHEQTLGVYGVIVLIIVIGIWLTGCTTIPYI